MDLSLSKRLKTFSRQCLLGVVATLPFPFSLWVYSAPWGRGFVNPYVTLSFSLPDFFLILASILFFVSQGSYRWKRGDMVCTSVFLCGVFITLLSLFFSPYTAVHHSGFFELLLAVKILELIPLYFLIVNGVLKEKALIAVFVWIMTGEAFLGLFQVFSQTLKGSASALAQIQWGDFVWVRAYGTFPHPNIMAGFLVISLLATFLYNSKFPFLKKGLFLVQGLGLLVTFSRSGILALFFALLFLIPSLFKKYKSWGWASIGVSLGLFILLVVSRGIWVWKDPALLGRLSGLMEAVMMFKNHLFGVGFGHYTLFLDSLHSTPLMPWEYQPVHNLYLLFIAELGVFGLIFGFVSMILLLVKARLFQKTLSTHFDDFKKRVVLSMGLSILVIGFFDHYFLSLEMGRFLLVLVLGLFSYLLATPLRVFAIKRG